MRYLLILCLFLTLPAAADEALELYQQMRKTTSPLAAAEQAYETALAAASTPAQRFPVLFARASYLVDCQEFARAEPLAREAVQLGEGDARRDASVLLGRVLTGLGRWREAEQAIVAGARPGPIEKDFYACEAACKLALEQGHYPRAEILVRRYNTSWSRVVVRSSSC